MSAAIDDISDRHSRKLDRERRLAEIEETYKNVVKEAKQEHDSIYNTVFNESAEITEAVIVEMQHVAQRRIDQQREKEGNFFSRLTNSIPFLSSNQTMMPSVAKSDSADISLATLSESDEDELSHKGRKSRSSALCFVGYHKTTVMVRVVGAAVILVLAIALIVTTLNFDRLSTSTKEKMRLIESVLVEQKVESSTFSRRSSPQHKALVWLAKEIESGKLQYNGLENKTEVVMDAEGHITSINEAYGEKRELLERFVLVTLYQATTSTDSWLKDDKWMEEGLSICSGWYGVVCAVIPKEGPQISVVTNLELGENGMKGMIPNELAHLSALTKLHLDGNALTGTLPNTFGDLASLSSLRISENNLIGIVPDSVCKLKDDGMLHEIESSCGGGNGKIECRCCTECI